MNQTVNIIRLIQNLTHLLKIYRTCKLTVGFSKYVVMLIFFVWEL